jgi:hypothetical protein
MPDTKDEMLGIPEVLQSVEDGPRVIKSLAKDRALVSPLPNGTSELSVTRLVMQGRRTGRPTPTQHRMLW